MSDLIYSNPDPIWFYCEQSPEPNGVWYYRTLLPAMGLTDAGEGHSFFDETINAPVRYYEDDTGDEAEKYRERIKNSERALYRCNVLQMSSRAIEYYRMIEKVRESRKRETGSVPVFIFDKDDSEEYVHPTNDAYKFLGTRLPDGTLVEKGQEVSIAGKDGKPIVLWRDGERGFDAERNRKNIEQGLENARFSDVVTVTTQELADYYREQGCEHVYIRPNAIRFKDFHDVRLQEDGITRILWQGGSSHVVDWYEIREALVRVVSEAENVKLVIFGAGYSPVFKGIPEDKIEFIPWVPIMSYHFRLCSIGHDIAIAPLADTKFNRCKSAIKWYESAAIPHKPAAVLARGIPPYTEITHGVNGLLYDEPEDFAINLKALIENVELRKRLAKNAHEWVKENRENNAVTKAWAAYLREQIARVNPKISLVAG